MTRAPSRFTRFVPEFRLPGFPLTALALALTLVSCGGGSLDKTVRSIAVLPFENLMDDPSQAYFVYGMQEGLHVDLSYVRVMRMTALTSTRQYSDTTKSIPEIARELGVDAVITGTVLKADDEVTITIQLLDGETGALLWERATSDDLDDVAALQRQLAQTLARKLGAPLSKEEKARLHAPPAAGPLVYDLYLQGRYLLFQDTAASVRRASVYFERAFQVDWTYGPAYAGLARAFFLLGQDLQGRYPDDVMPLADLQAALALDRDDQQSEAYAVLGQLGTIFQWDRIGAEQALQRAVTLNPSNIWAHTGYARYYAILRQYDAAIESARRVLQLDPLNPRSRVLLAEVLYYARRYDEVVEACLTALELDPNYAEAYEVLRWPFEVMELYAEAIATNQDPELRQKLEEAYAQSGREGYWRERLKQQIQVSELEYPTPTQLAAIHAALGEDDEALSRLAEAYIHRDGALAFMRVEAQLDPLRADPRFQQLLNRVYTRQ